MKKNYQQTLIHKIVKFFNNKSKEEDTVNWGIRTKEMISPFSPTHSKVLSPSHLISLPPSNLSVLSPTKLNSTYTLPFTSTLALPFNSRLLSPSHLIVIPTRN